MMSAQGQAIPDITSLIQVSDDYVRGITHAFNERGSVLSTRIWTQMSGAGHRRSTRGRVNVST
jgi:hypothetical protein